VAYAESDLIVTVFTEDLGRVSALARGARKSQRRFGGALEPMHTLRLGLDERPSGDLFILREAGIDRARYVLTENLEALDAAGQALGWLRSVFVPRTPEPVTWALATRLLDELDAPDRRPARVVLAEFGMRLLAALGWGLELERCTRCGKACEPARAAFIDAVRGGLVCRACGGARVRLAGALRRRLAELAAHSDAELFEADVDAALDLVQSALRAHAGLE
jgi:DNA repair protein RecO (recombination protein O)